jgi:tetratricopeptide (TPR) repeat protein
LSKLTTHQRKARDLMQREDWDGALAELQRVLSLDADNPTLHNQIGDVHLRKGDVDQACDHFEMAVDLYSNLGLHNNAVALCRKVVRLAPTRVEVRYHLARLRMDQGLRSDAGSAFVDYLEHAHPEDDEAADALEQRCVDVVESFPDIAPVGQILEKLEAVKRPQGAYRIVQRAAQRAADSGDSKAAKRLTEKMRSLRVLLESQGGASPVDETTGIEDALDSTAADTAAQESAGPAEVDPPESPPAAEASNSAARPSYTDPGAIDLPGVDDVASAAAETPQVELPDVVDQQEPQQDAGGDPVEVSEDQDEAVPEIDLDAVDSLEDTLAAFEDDLQTDEVPTDEAQTNEVQANEAHADEAQSDEASSPADDLIGDAPSGALPSAAPEAEASSEAIDETLMPEYELPETSLEEVAGLLQQQGVEPTGLAEVDDEAETQQEAPQDVELPQHDPSEEDVEPSLLQSDDERGVPQQAASIAETFSDPVGEPTQTSLNRSGTGEGQDDDRPASVVYEPVPGARRPGTGQDDVRRQPVWIPSPDTVSEDPTPSEEGQTQELEEVIDTFREQMARALGDDGAARYDLGVAYYDMGLYNEALAEFEVAVKCPGLANRTLEMMAACLAQQGRHDEVVSLLAGPLSENDKPTQERLALQYAMGLALEAVGQQEDARRHFEEVALVDIGFKDVQSRLQR